MTTEQQLQKVRRQRDYLCRALNRIALHEVEEPCRYADEVLSGLVFGGGGGFPRETQSRAIRHFEGEARGPREAEGRSAMMSNDLRIQLAATMRDLADAVESVVPDSLLPVIARGIQNVSNTVAGLRKAQSEGRC